MRQTASAPFATQLTYRESRGLSSYSSPSDAQKLYSLSVRLLLSSRSLKNG